MKRFHWVLAGGLGLGLLAGCSLFNGGKCVDGECTGQPKLGKTNSLHPDSRNWSSLFELDLSNTAFPEGVWFIDENGNLTANKDEAIWTTRDYENLILDLEYTCDPAANSGVLIYCSDTANWIPNCVEVQILDDDHPHWANEKPTAKNGGLYGHLAPKVNNVKPAGEWNRMTITAQGQQIKVVVNEEVTVDTNLSAWTSAKKNPDGSDIPPWLSRPWAELDTKGRIGLQGKHGAATIFFRNIRIREL